LFEFATTARILFGEGVIEQLPDVVLRFGKRVLVVAGASRARATSAVDGLERHGCDVAWTHVSGEPTVEDIGQGLAAARNHSADVVLAIGGGSVLDTAKAVAAVATNPGNLLDYLEIVGGGKALPRAGLPCIAVPTTAGTGAEVTRNAVIGVPSHATKVSLRGETLLPRVALLDPRLSVSVPASITAASGLDALTQVIEPYVSNRSNPMTDALATAGISLAANALRRAFHDGCDIAARSDMVLVSLWGGMCLANARLGAVHGLAGPIGGMFHAPHGAICAALLGPVMRANVEVCQRKAAESATLGRYAEIARLVTGNALATIEEGIAWIEQLTRELGIVGLGQLGVTPDKFGEIVERAERASSMQGNPVRLGPVDITAVLEAAL
jgi:alcohol dehydrogenase class IV